MALRFTLLLWCFAALSSLVDAGKCCTCSAPTAHIVSWEAVSSDSFQASKPARSPVPPSSSGKIEIFFRCCDECAEHLLGWQGHCCCDTISVCAISTSSNNGYAFIYPGRTQRLLRVVLKSKAESPSPALIRFIASPPRLLTQPAPYLGCPPYASHGRHVNVQ